MYKLSSLQKKYISNSNGREKTKLVKLIPNSEHNIVELNSDCIDL